VQTFRKRRAGLSATAGLSCLFKSDFLDFSKICIFLPSFCQIFETGLSAQSHKQHGRYASAISG